MDPLWEKFPNISPYGAMNNRPNIFTDPTGMAPGGGNGSDDDENDSEGYGSNLTQLNLQKPKTINDGVEITSPIKETIETGVKEAPGKAAKVAGKTSKFSGGLAIVCAVAAIPTGELTAPGAVFFAGVATGAQVAEIVAAGVDVAVNPSEKTKDALIESTVHTAATFVGGKVVTTVTKQFAREGSSGRFYQKGTRGSIPSTEGRAIVAVTMGLEAAGASAVANIILNFFY